MRHVRDVDLQFEVAVSQSRDQHGVIEIACGFAVNGNDWKTAKLASLADLSGRHYGLGFLGLAKHFWRKAVRQVKFANHDFDVHAEIVRVAQNFDDAAPWILRCRRPLGDLDINGNIFQIAPVSPAGGFVTKNAVLRNRRWSLIVRRSRGHLGALCACCALFTNIRGLSFGQRGMTNDQRLVFRIFHSLGDDDLLRNLLVDRDHVVVSRSVMENSDDGGMSTINRPNNPPFGPSTVPNVDDLDQHAIAMHGRTNGMRRDENVAGQSRLQIGGSRSQVGNHEPEAVAMLAEFPRD